MESPSEILYPVYPKVKPILIPKNWLIKNKSILEIALTISIGTFLHCMSLSVLDLNLLGLQKLQPNSASIIFTISMLCIMSRLRPSFINLIDCPILLRFVTAITFSLYVTEAALRLFWIPALKVILYGCSYLSSNLLESSWKSYYKQLLFVGRWLEKDGFYLCRSMLAAIVFVIMTKFIDVWSDLKEFLLKNC